MKKPRIWAHRGGRRWAEPQPPENSLTAFRKCLEAGVYGIEIDVHKCKSGELVVLHGGVHGGDVSHHSAGKGLVKDLTWDELKALELSDSAVHGTSSTTASTTADASVPAHVERIPLLSEVFELLRDKVVVNIEIKNAPWDYAGFADDLIAIIAKYNLANTVVLSSFDHGILKEIHEKAPQLKLGILIDGLIVGIAEYAAKIGFTCWHPYLGELRTDYMDEAHKAGLEVNVWTANTADEWQLALDLDVDGIVTDDPIGLHEFLEKKFAPPAVQTTEETSV